MADPKPTLDEYNRRKQEERRRTQRTSGTVSAGVLCPECLTEMVIKDPNVKLMSNPPKVRVDCLNCNHIDYMEV